MLMGAYPTPEARRKTYKEGDTNVGVDMPKAPTVGTVHAAREGTKYNDTKTVNTGLGTDNGFAVRGQSSRESNQKAVNSRHGMPYKKPQNFLGEGGPLGDISK